MPRQLSRQPTAAQTGGDTRHFTHHERRAASPAVPFSTLRRQAEIIGVLQHGRVDHRLREQ